MKMYIPRQFQHLLFPSAVVVFRDGPVADGGSPPPGTWWAGLGKIVGLILAV